MLLFSKGFYCYCCLAAVSCLTLCDPIDCCPPGSSVHWISQARILELVFLLQGIFPTQGSNLHLLHWWVDSLPLSHQGSPQTQPSLYPNLRLPASRPVRKFNSVVEATQSRYLVSAAAAKSLQSCPTLCDPIDGSLPGSSVPGILQARTLEWVAISFSNA